MVCIRANLCVCFQDEWGSSDSSSKSKAHISDDKTNGLETLPPGTKLHYPSCTATTQCLNKLMYISVIAKKVLSMYSFIISITRMSDKYVLQDLERFQCVIVSAHDYSKGKGQIHPSCKACAWLTLYTTVMYPERHIMSPQPNPFPF